MLHSPASVALLVHRRKPLPLVGRDPMRARLAQPPIEQPRRALGLIAHPQPPECPLRTAQPLRRLQRAQPAATVALVDLLEPHLSYLLQHLCPSHRRPPRRSGSKPRRSEEHTSELQSLMRNSYAVFCLKKKPINIKSTHSQHNY